MGYCERKVLQNQRKINTDHVFLCYFHGCGLIVLKVCVLPLYSLISSVGTNLFQSISLLITFPLPCHQSPFLRYLLDHMIHVKSLSRCLSAPPPAVIVREYNLPVIFKHFCHIRCDKPPFKHIIQYLRVLNPVPETVVQSDQFIDHMTLFIQNQSVHNLLCCHIYKRKMPSLNRNGWLNLN